MYICGMNKLPDHVMIGVVKYMRESLVESEPPEGYKLTGESLRESVAWVGELVNKKNMILGETKEVTVTYELTSRFNEALGVLNNHNVGLDNAVRNLTGESRRDSLKKSLEDDGSMLDSNSVIVVEPSLTEKLDKMINRLEVVNREMEESFIILKKYL